MKDERRLNKWEKQNREEWKKKKVLQKQTNKTQDGFQERNDNLILIESRWATSHTFWENKQQTT